RLPGSWSRCLATCAGEPPGSPDTLHWSSPSGVASDAAADRRLRRRLVVDYQDADHPRTAGSSSANAPPADSASAQPRAPLAVAHLVEGLGEQLVGRPELGPRARGARLEAREVEQVRDETVEPLALGADRLQEGLSIDGGELEGGRLERGDRRRDGGQGRAQI